MGFKGMKKDNISTWLHMLLIPTVWSLKQADFEFEASLAYQVCTRTARAIKRIPVSLNQKKKKI